MIRVHAAISLYNDRTFLAATLESIKDIVDSIIVVDGAYQTYLENYREFVPHATAWSTDGTLKILEAFCGKPEFHLFTTANEKTCWPTQLEKRNFLINQIPDGDCFLIIDADEMLMGDVQEAMEKFYESGCLAAQFYESGCLAAQFPLYTPGLHQDRIIPRWHPRIFIKKPGMHYKGTHWHLRDRHDRIIEEKYPLFWTDLMAVVHFKSFKDQTRLIPHQNYMATLAERGWTEVAPGRKTKSEEDMKPWKNEKKNL